MLHEPGDRHSGPRLSGPAASLPPATGNATPIPPLAHTSGPEAGRIRTQASTHLVEPRTTLSAAPDDSISPKSSSFREVAHTYRLEWPSIPASLSSSFVSVATASNILKLPRVNDLIESWHPILGGAACLGLNTALWYFVYRCVLNPAFSRLLGNKPPTEEPSAEVKDARKRAEGTFVAYSVVFNLAQWVAQSILLWKGVDPATATVWNSAVSNVLFLSTLPWVIYLCRRHAGLSLDGHRIQTSASESVMRQKGERAQGH